MRTHAQIIDRPAHFARAIQVSPNSVKAWKRGNSIPARYWARVKRAGLATLDELADAEERSRLPPSDEIDLGEIETDPSKPGSALLFFERIRRSALGGLDLPDPDRSDTGRSVDYLLDEV